MSKPDFGAIARATLPSHSHLWTTLTINFQKVYELGHAQGKVDAAEFLQKILVQNKKLGEK